MSPHGANAFSELMTRAGLGIEEAAGLLGVNPRTVRRYINGERKRIDLLKLDKLREVANARCPADRPEGFRFIDLFAGVGGLRRPFEEIGGRCVFTSEWDRFCKETYTANFPEPADSDHKFVGDIRPYAEKPETVPAHDVLLAGFPCQPFSIAGVSKKNALGRPHGFLCDTQGTLFYDLAKIIAHHRPPAFLLENVKHLERHDGGRTFATVMQVLETDLGYSVSTRVVDSSPWVPQKRERIFVVGFRERTAFDFDELEKPSGRAPALHAVLDTEVDPKYTLTRHLWQYLQDYKKKHRRAGNGFGYSLFGPDDVARTLSARYYKDGSEILIKQKGRRPRRLTPRECARLMGFEKPGEAEFKIPVSDTQAYRQFGNAVVVPVVRTVAQLMKPHIAELLARDGRELPSATPDVRSRMMAGIRGKNTKPEMAVRSVLHRLGFRFRVHRKDLPGKPDLVFSKHNAVVFVHGCFWHGHDCHLFKWPRTRSEFWRQKITSNGARDRKHLLALADDGWRVATIWECALKGRSRLPIEAVTERCTGWLESDESEMDLSGK